MTKDTQQEKNLIWEFCPKHIHILWPWHKHMQCFKMNGIKLYQSPLILTELFQHNLINVSYLTACYLYQVMMTLHFLNDVANDAESV